MSVRPVLVLGASGGLGRRLANRLSANEDLRLRALVHRSPFESPGFERVRGGLEDLDSLVAGMRDVHTVLHLAAITHTNDIARYDAVNRQGTEHVVTACERAGVSRLIYVSSSAAHPDGGGYAASKWAAERAVERASCEHLILRPTEVYGAGQNEGINRLIDWVRRRPIVPIIGDGRTRVCPVSVADVDDALVLALRRTELGRRALVIGGPEVMTFDTLIDRLAAHFGVRRLKLHLPVALAERTFGLAARLRPQSFSSDQVARFLTAKQYDVDTAPRLLGYAPRPLEQGLRELGL